MRKLISSWFAAFFHVSFYEADDGDLTSDQIEAIRKTVPQDKKSVKSSLFNKTSVLRYDNELGKGNHLHINDQEIPYVFVSPNQLLKDFFAQIKQMESAR